MKSYIILLSVMITIISCQTKKGDSATSDQDMGEHVHSLEPNMKQEKKVLSPRISAMANIADAHIHIDYSSPGKRGRVIWNGLVAFGEVWVTGAHKATSIDFSDDVEIAGKTIAKGKYALFTIPDSKEWTIILNKNYDQHLADEYDMKEDVIRVKATPQILEKEVESLTFAVISTENNLGYVSISWGNLEVRLPILVK